MKSTAGIACLPEFNKKNNIIIDALDSSPRLGQIGDYNKGKHAFLAPTLAYSVESDASTEPHSAGSSSKQALRVNTQNLANTQGTRASAALILEEMKSQKRADHQKASGWNEDSFLSVREEPSLHNPARSYKQEVCMRSNESEGDSSADLDTDNIETTEVPMSLILENMKSEAEATQRKLLSSGIGETSYRNLDTSGSGNYKPPSLCSIPDENTFSFQGADTSPTQATYSRVPESRVDAMDLDQPANFMLPLPMLPTHIYQPSHFVPPEYQYSTSNYVTATMPIYNPMANLQYMATQNSPLSPYTNGSVVPFAYPYCRMPFPQNSSPIGKQDLVDPSEFYPNNVSSWGAPSQDLKTHEFMILGHPERPYKKRQRKASRVETYCQQCGATSTPEWRKGPEGSRTLCNACGLFHAKMCRKRGETEALRLLKERQASPRM